MTFLVVWANAGVVWGSRNAVHVDFLHCIGVLKYKCCRDTFGFFDNRTSFLFPHEDTKHFHSVADGLSNERFFFCLLLVVVFLLFLVKVSRLPSGGGHFRAAIKLNWIIAAHIVLMHARTVANDPFKSLQSVFGAKDNGTEQPQVS